MKNKKRGFSLVEVIIAMFFISVLFVSFTGAFSQSFVMTKKGYDITVQTFDHQEIMENSIISTKDDLLNNLISTDETITVFSGNYQVDVDLKKIEENIQGGRNLTSYVSKIPLGTPAIPGLTLTVKALERTTTNEVFPWFEDDVEIRADYTLNTDPLILGNRTRWFVSKDGIHSPVFSSEYTLLSEKEEIEPAGTVYSESINNKSGTTDYKITKTGFYYFEARPFTFAGRLAYYSNPERIPVISKSGTSLNWQQLIEDVYFENYGSRTIKFNNLDESVYAEVIQNPAHPTLNTDWVGNVDSQGAQIAHQLPFGSNDFETTVTLKVDQETIDSNPSSNGFGLYLGNNNNDGIMVNFNVKDNTLAVYKLVDGKYDGFYQSIVDMSTDSKFLPLQITVDGTPTFDWTKTYNVKLKKSGNNLEIELIDKDDSSIKSDSVSFAVGSSHSIGYLGFKSYSSLDYVVDDRLEISNKYARNYGTHFYDVNYSVVPIDSIIQISEIEGVSIPISGGVPSYSIIENVEYTGTIEWILDDNPFDENIIYTATITIVPKTGYTLSGVPENFFTVSGANSVSNSANSGIVTAVFPRTTANLIADLGYVVDESYGEALRNKIYVDFIGSFQSLTDVDETKIKIMKDSVEYSVVEKILYDSTDSKWVFITDKFEKDNTANIKIVFESDALGNTSAIEMAIPYSDAKSALYRINAKHTEPNVRYLYREDNDVDGIQQYSWDAKSNKSRFSWYLVPTASANWPIDPYSLNGNEYYIRNLSNNRYITVSGNQNNATNVSLTNSASNNGKFVFWKSSDYYSIVSTAFNGANPRDHLDINGGSQSNGASLIRWTDHGGDNQKFKLELMLEDVN